MEKIKLKDAVEEMFIGPFGSALKNEYFVSKEKGYCMVYEQKHAIKKQVGSENRYITEDKFNELKRFEVGPDDIIMSCRGTVGELFLIPKGSPKGVIHPSLMKIKVNKKLYNPEFLIILLKYYLKSVNNDGTSIKMAIKAKDLGNVLFPLPTLEEQNDLVEKINNIYEIIKNKEAMLMSLNNYISNKYDELFGTDSKSKLGDLCNIHARIGWQGLTKKEYLENGEYKLITGIDFNESNRINFDSCVYISKERYDQDNKIQVHDNDILVTKDGTIGKVAIIKNLSHPATLNSGVFVLRPNNNNLLPEYIMFSLMTSRFKQFIEKIKTGATIPHLNQKAFINFEIPTPSIEKQIAFKNIIEMTDLLKSNIQLSIIKLNKLIDMINYEFFN